MSYGRLRISREIPTKIKENQGREGQKLFFLKKNQKKSREKFGGIKINP